MTLLNKLNCRDNKILFIVITLGLLSEKIDTYYQIINWYKTSLDLFLIITNYINLYLISILV